MFVTGVVLAAGGSSRLGVAKQLLAYRGTTLLEATLNTARRCGFDQLVVTLGAFSEQIRAQVDLSGTEIALNDSFGSGCSSSIRSALEHIAPSAGGVVLLLGDQPAVSPKSVRRLVRQTGRFPIGVCRYDDGLGHPFWFHRQVFSDLGSLHGDKAVWKLLESGRHQVAEVLVPGAVPFDVDTWEDYASLLAKAEDNQSQLVEVRPEARRAATR